MPGILEIVHNYIIWQRVKKANRDENRIKSLNKWLNSGKPIPPPHVAKQEVIRKFQKDFSIKTLVETGTFWGEMVYAQRNYFDKIYSIELSKELHQIAVRRLKNLPNVTLLQGDSAEVLKKITGEIMTPAIFWLDGHYSGFETAKGDLVTPINRELDIIFESQQNHILLIDDARLFNGEDDYPELKELKSRVLKEKNNYSFNVEDDIIRIYPDFRST